MSASVTYLRIAPTSWPNAPSILLRIPRRVVTLGMNWLQVERMLRADIPPGFVLVALGRGY